MCNPQAFYIPEFKVVDVIIFLTVPEKTVGQLFFIIPFSTVLCSFHPNDNSLSQGLVMGVGGKVNE